MAHLHVKTPNGTTYSIDLDAINANGGSSNSNGYTLMNNGCIFQWGVVTGNVSYANVTFQITFPASCYNIVVGDGSSKEESTDTDGYDFCAGVNKLSTSGFRVSKARDQLCYYLAIGI